jgi:MFS family permease
MFRWTAFVLAVTAVGAAVPTPLYPIYETRFGFAAGTLGVIFAGYTAGVLLVMFLLAPQAERVGRRRLLALGMVLTAFAAVDFAYSNGVAWLAIGRLISGMSVGATTSVATATMADLEPNHDQHHVARVAVAANFGGFALAVLLSGLLVQFAPDRTQLPYLLPFAASLIGLYAVRRLPETATALGARPAHRVQRISIPADLRRPFWVAAGGIAACYALYGLFAALVPSYLRVGLGVSSPAVAGALVALMFGTAAATQLFTSEIRDRRALLVGFPLLLASLVAFVSALGFAASGVLVGVTVVLGAAVGLTYMGSTTLADRIAPENERGELLAGFYSAGYLSLALPTVGVAVAASFVGLTDAAIALGAVVAVIVAVLYASTFRTPTPPGGGGRPRDRIASP